MSSLMAVTMEGCVCLMKVSDDIFPIFQLWLEKCKDSLLKNNIVITKSSIVTAQGRNSFNDVTMVTVEDGQVKVEVPNADGHPEGLSRDSSPAREANNMEADERPNNGSTETFGHMFKVETKNTQSDQRLVFKISGILKESLDYFLKSAVVVKITDDVQRFISEHKADLETLLQDFLLLDIEKIESPFYESYETNVFRDDVMEETMKIDSVHLCWHKSYLYVILPSVCTENAFLANSMTSTLKKVLSDELAVVLTEAATWVATDYQNAIFHATESNQILLLKLLIYTAKKAIPNFALSCDKQFLSPFDVCSNKEALLTLKEVTGKISPKPLINAICKLDFDMAAILIDIGADLNACDETGMSPIHQVIQLYVDGFTKEAYSFCELLYIRNVQTNIKDASGRTPLEVFIKNTERPIDPESMEFAEYDDILEMLRCSSFPVRARKRSHSRTRNDRLLSPLRQSQEPQKQSIVEVTVSVKKGPHPSSAISRQAKLCYEISEVGTLTGRSDGTPQDGHNMLNAVVEPVRTIIHNLPASYKIIKEEIDQVALGPRVLCLDGGGVRGVNEVEIIEAIQNAYQALHPGKTIYDMFDIFVGTSTGAMVAMCIAMRKSLAEMRQFYDGLHDYILKEAWPRSNERLLKHTQDTLGGATFGDIPAEKDVYVTSVVPSSGKFENPQI